MIKVYPAILTDDIQDFNEKLGKVKFAKCIQIDIMDGRFVRNKSITAKDLKKIKINKKVEYHLMIQNPEEKIDEFLSLRPYSIIFHYEACKKIDYLIGKIKSRKIRVGLAINPETKVEKISPYLKKIDSVLIMTVHPGFSGGKFIQSSLHKIKKLRKKTKIPIEVDGHIDDKTSKLVKNAGANVLISSTYIFKNNPEQAYLRLLKQ